MFKVKNYASKKRFLCTQFVAWTIQLSVAVLHEMHPDQFPLNIVDVLPIRDTKAIPARLAKLLKNSSHFIEFKSEESYGVPLIDPVPIDGVALGLIGEFGDPDFSEPLQSKTGGIRSLDDILNEPIPSGLQAPVFGGPSILDEAVPQGLQEPLIPFGAKGPAVPKRQAPLPPSALKRQGAFRRKHP